MNLLRLIFITPGEARLRSGWRLLFHLLLLFFLFPIVSLLLYGLASLTPVLAFLGDEIFLALVGITLSIWLARRFLDRRSFKSLGLQWDGAASRDLLAGILIPALSFVLVFLVEWGFGWLEFRGFTWQAVPGSGLEIGYWAAAFLMVGWYEELLSRGYWLQNLAAGLGMPLAVFLSSAVFALAHFANPNASLAAVLGILGAGYFLAYAYLRTRQLWLPIGLHIGWNFFEGPVFGFPVSGLETGRLILHEVNGPELITGGAFGPEGGLIVLPALALGAYLVHRYTARRQPAIEEGTRG